MATAAQELAQFESDAVINLKDIKKTVEASKAEFVSPRSGPFTAERNQEVFKVGRESYEPQTCCLRAPLYGRH